jgi:hypothetical protein
MFLAETELRVTKLEYENEAIDILIKEIPAFNVEEVGKFLAWGHSEGQRGAEYFADKLGLSALHLAAFRNDKEFKDALELYREPSFA